MTKIRLPKIALPVDRYDAAAAVGLALLCYGLYLVSEPLAWIAGGAALLAFGLLGAQMRVRGRR
jgi:hypothetical protein